MDELKTVLEIIGRMSGDAAGLGTWWIVLHYGVQALAIIAVSACVVTVVYLITRSLVRHSAQCDLLREIAEIVDMPQFFIESFGYRRKLIDVIRKLKGAK